MIIFDKDFLKKVTYLPKLLLYKKQFQYINKRQWVSLKDNQNLQKKCLYETLQYAIQNINYYKKAAAETNFRYSEDTIYKDIEHFPVLTKNIIRENLQDLINPKLIAISKPNSSGGTTGEPVTIYQQDSNLELTNIFTFMQYEWTGYKQGEVFLQLWGNEQEIFKYKDKASGIIKVAPNHYILNTFHMSEEKMKNYCDFINEKQPTLILAYVQSAYEIAKFIKERKIKIYSPRAIMTSAGTLYPSYKLLIEKTFHCPVFNRYGSREVHSIACDCDKHEGLHLDMFNHYVEILDDKLHPVRKEGEKGTVYITLFNNNVMPLIRYKLGDIAIYTRHKCSCGRGLPLIKTIIGRNVDIFVNSQGEKIDGEYFTHLFYLKNYIKKFQVIQKTKNKIVINMVLDKTQPKWQNDSKKIVEKIKLVMGNNCKVIFNAVKYIKPAKSGKFRYTISEVS
jgi:phenylacetate-CoA ligase